MKGNGEKMQKATNEGGTHLLREIEGSAVGWSIRLGGHARTTKAGEKGNTREWEIQKELGTRSVEALKGYDLLQQRLPGQGRREGGTKLISERGEIQPEAGKGSTERVFMESSRGREQDPEGRKGRVQKESKERKKASVRQEIRRGRSEKTKKNRRLLQNLGAAGESARMFSWGKKRQKTG